MQSQAKNLPTQMVLLPSSAVTATVAASTTNVLAENKSVAEGKLPKLKKQNAIIIVVTYFLGWGDEPKRDDCSLISLALAPVLYVVYNAGAAELLVLVSALIVEGLNSWSSPSNQRRMLLFVYLT